MEAALYSGVVELVEEEYTGVAELEERMVLNTPEPKS